MEESFAMNGGDDLNSYTQNSKYQEEALDEAKVLLINSIQEKLIIHNNSHATIQFPSVFRIADLGCSVGPNTFACVQTIIEAVKLKFKTQGLASQLPEFHVFFNDHVANDFNTLFKTLPFDRTYMAAGVPGSFHGRLFPKASMNFMHSSSALHWLTRVPQQVTQEESPAWNKGRITYVSSSSEVEEAYTAQFLSDMEAFFAARSEELAEDGLLAILMPCRPDATLPSDSVIMFGFECLGHALADMAKEGLVSEALLDLFNLPMYIPSATEVKGVMLGFHISIERLEELYYPTKLNTPDDIRVSSLHVRAVMEGILCKHFGPELIDELFKRYSQKLEEFSKTPQFTGISKMENLFMLVKRNAVCHMKSNAAKGLYYT